MRCVSQAPNSQNMFLAIALSWTLLVELCYLLLPYVSIDEAVKCKLDCYSSIVNKHKPANKHNLQLYWPHFYYNQFNPWQYLVVLFYPLGKKIVASH